MASRTTSSSSSSLRQKKASFPNKLKEKKHSKSYVIEDYDSIQQQLDVDSKTLEDTLPYEYYQAYSPYSYNVAGKPYITLFNAQDGSCSATASYQRQFIVNNECVKSTSRTPTGEVEFSLTVVCQSNSPFSSWNAVIFNSPDCGSSAITRVVGDGPCNCQSFDVDGQNVDLKVNCGGIVFFPCNAYFDDAYYYGASSSISVYSNVYSNQQCITPPVPMTALIGKSNRTNSGTNGLSIQNGHCVTGELYQNTSLGYVIECKEPTTTSKWLVSVYNNCTNDALKAAPLAVLKGSNPCQCSAGETNGIPYSVTVNCAGSTSFTCAATTQASLLNAEHIAGAVVGSVAVFAILLALLYPIVSYYIFMTRESHFSTSDEENFQDTEKSSSVKPFSSASAPQDNRESDVSVSRDSEKTIITNPLSAGSKTIMSMDMISNMYEPSDETRFNRRPLPDLKERMGDV